MERRCRRDRLFSQRFAVDGPTPHPYISPMYIPFWIYLVALAEGLIGIGLLFWAQHSVVIAIIGAILLADAIIGPALLSLGYFDWLIYRRRS
jgi:hypothetical protein